MSCTKSCQISWRRSNVLPNKRITKTGSIDRPHNPCRPHHQHHPLPKHGTHPHLLPQTPTHLPLNSGTSRTRLRPPIVITSLLPQFTCSSRSSCEFERMIRHNLTSVRQDVDIPVRLEHTNPNALTQLFLRDLSACSTVSGSPTPDRTKIHRD